MEILKLANKIILIFGFLAATFAESPLPIPNKTTLQSTIKNEPIPTILEDKSILTPEERSTRAKFSNDGFVPGPDYRLPTNLIPLEYNLMLTPIIDGDYPGIGVMGTAPGFISILISCNEPTTKIVLHAKLLSIDEESILLYKDPSRFITIRNVEYDEERDFLILNVYSEDILQKGQQYTLSISFIAEVPPNDSLRGLYTEEYFDPLTNQTKVMAVTQLEPTRARQVFPCFDEPTYKSAFEVSIRRTGNFISIANGPILTSFPDTLNPGWFIDKFGMSVRMPTYLFAIAITSSYLWTEAPENLYRMPVKTYGPTHLIMRGEMDFSAVASAKLMAYYEEKYEISYPAHKLDSISVPYKNSGMENWGLVTYGEEVLRYNEYSTSADLRQNLKIIAHELGHQWFGNLVTCKWWSDIWLNEGFTSYVCFVSQQALWPEFNMTTEMIDSMNNALRYDATPSSHPIHNDVYSSDEIARNLDAIGYDKGLSISRMMASFLGEEIFYNGIRQYLKTHQNDVVEQDDLFDALNEAANNAGVELPKSLNKIMHSWTLQKGFPLIRVSLDVTGNHAIISQEPFVNGNVRNDTDNLKTSWDVPIKYAIIDNDVVTREGSLWLLNDGQPKTVPLSNEREWIIINTDAGGYYRTLYDNSIYKTRMNLENIARLLSPEGKVRLLDDQYNLMRQEYVPLLTALNFTRLTNENDGTVWSVALSYLDQIKYFYRRVHFESELEENEKDLQAFEKWLDGGMGRLFRNIPESVHEQPSSLAILRALIFSWYCDIKVATSEPLCTEYALDYYNKLATNPAKNPIPNDIQETAYCMMVEYVPDSFQLLLDMYFKSSSEVEKIRLSKALGCSQNSADIDQLFQLTIFANASSPRRIEKDHTISMFQNLVIRSFVGRYNLNEISRLNKEAIPDYYDRNPDLAKQIFAPLIIHGCTQSDAELLKDVWQSNAPFWEDAFEYIEFRLAENMEWLKANRQSVTEYFRSNQN